MSDLVSPGKRAAQIRARTADYLVAGLNWDPRTETARPTPGGWVIAPKEPREPGGAPQQPPPPTGPDTPEPASDGSRRASVQAPPAHAPVRPAAGQEAPESPGPDPEVAKRAAERARIRNQGRDAQHQQLLYKLLSKRITLAGKEVNEQTLEEYTERARARARSGAYLSPIDADIVHIDAMVRRGRRYDSPEELRQKYAQEELEWAREEAQAPEEPTQAPNVEVRVQTRHKEIGAVPGWESPDDATRAFSDKLIERGAGSAGAVAVGLARDPEHNQLMAKVSKVKPEDARALGYDLIAKRLERHGSPYREDGPLKRKEVTVFVGQNSDGTFAFDEQTYRQAFEVLYAEVIRREDYKKPVQALTEQEKRDIREEARRRAQRDVASFTARHLGSGQVAVNTDPRGRIEALMAGETPWYGWFTPASPVVRGGLRLLGADWAADTIEAAARPFFAVGESLSGRGSLSTAYGTQAMHIQTENPIHSFLRAGLWSVIGAWWTAPEGTQWGDRTHLERYMQGYDFTQDMRSIGEALASVTPFADNETAEWLLGGVGTLGLALVEPDLLGGAITGVAGGAKAGSKLLTAGVAARDATRTAAELREMARTIDANNPASLEAFQRTPAAHFVGPTLMQRVAREIDLRTPITPATVLEKGEKAAKREAKVATKAAERAEKEAQKAAEAQAKRQARYEAAVEKHVKALDEAEAALGKETVAAQKELTAREIAFLDAKKRFDHAEKMRDVVEQLPPSVLKPRKGHKVEYNGKEYTYERALNVGGQRHARLVDDAGEYVTVPITQVTRKTPWTRADLARKEDLRGRYQHELRTLRADLEAADRANDIKMVKQLQAREKKVRGKLRAIQEILGESLQEAGLTRILDEYTEAGKALRFARRELDQARMNAAQALRKRKLELLEAKQAKARVVAVDPAKQAAKEEKVTAELDEAMRVIRDGKVDIFAAQDQLYRKRYEGMNSAEATQRIFRETLLDLANEYDRLAAVIRTRMDATPAASQHLKFTDTIVGQMEAPAAGAEILTRMEAAYGPKDKWGALLKDPMMEILEAHSGAVFDLSEEFIERMFRFEQKVHAQVKYGDQWVTHRMANIAKEFWDPSSDLTRHYRKKWGSVDNVIAEVYRFIERRRRGWDADYQRFGTLSGEAKEAAHRAVNRFSVWMREIEKVLEAGGERGLADVIEYLNSHRKFADDIVGNQGEQYTHVQKFRQYVLGQLEAVTDEAGKVTYKLKDGADAVELDAFLRAAIPPGEYGIAAVNRIRPRLIDLLVDEDLDEVQLFSRMWDVVQAGTKGTYGRADTLPRQMRAAIYAVVSGANKFDLHKEMHQILGGRISPRDADAVNFLLAGGKKDGVPGGAGADFLVGPLNLERGWEVLEQLGYNVGTDKVQNVAWASAVGSLKETHRAVHKWMQAHPVGPVPEPIIRHLDKQMGGLVKEFEAFHSHGDAGSRTLAHGRALLSLWRQGVVLGHLLPRIQHFTNTAVEDVFQVMTTRGLRDAARQTAISAALYMDVFSIIPGVPKIGSKILAPPLMRFVMDPGLNAVMKGDPNTVFKLPDGSTITAERLLKDAKDDGAHEFIHSRELERQAARTIEGVVPETWRKWTRRAPEVLEDIQSRVRTAWYVRDRLNGASRVEAKRNMLEAFLDWQHKVTPWEAHSIAQLAAFYTFWRNAFSHVGRAFTQGIVKPDADYWVRVATGRTKLARTRQQGLLASATPEFLWWDDPEEELSSYEQLWDARKRKTPWWLGARPLLDNVPLSPEQQDWWRERGYDVNMAAKVLPMLTALDVLSLLTTFHTFTAMSLRTIAGDDSVVFSDDAPEILSNQISDMFAPIFSDAVEAFLKQARGEGGPDSRGVPLREGEAMALRAIPGLYDAVVTKMPDENGVERPMVSGLMHNILMDIFRLIPVVATDAPLAARIITDPAQQDPLSRAYLQAVFRDFTGLGASYVHNPDRTVDRTNRRTAAGLKAKKKELEARSGQSY